MDAGRQQIKRKKGKDAFARNAIGAAVFVLAQLAFAQQNTDSANELGAVVVTGQKIERSRQETLDSVAVIDEFDLEEKAQSTDLFDLVEQTANVSRDGSYSLQIRGVSTNGPTNTNDGGRTIGLYLDDAVVGPRAGSDGALSLWDVQSVEVLRGAQSTTGGRNSLAGAVHIKTKDPEFVSSGAARVGVGTYGTYEAAVAQTGPITDNLAYRIAVSHEHTDNHVENTFFNKDDWDAQSSTTVRGKLKYKQDNGGEWLLTASHSRFDDKGDDNTQVEPPRKRKSTDNYGSEWITENTILALKYKRPINRNWSFTNTTTYSQADFDRDSDPDGALGDGVLKQQTESNDFTQELLFNYENDKLRAVLGAYYSQGDLDDGYTVTKFPFPVPGGLPPAQLTVDVATKEKYKNFALFYNADYAFAPNWTFISGLRADHEQRDKYISSTAVRTNSFGVPAIDAQIDAQLRAIGGSKDGRESYTNLLPKVGLDYRWNDTLNTGFTIQRGYRPGGVSVNVVRGETRKFDAEFTTNYEFSLRKTSTDKRFKLNANVFYTQWKDQQVSVSGTLGPFDNYVENAGESHVQGLEIETSYQATDEWRINGYLGYAKTEFDEYKTGGLDLAGTKFPYARDWTAGFGVNYENARGFFAGAQLSYASDAINNAPANPQKIDSYTLLNLRAGYRQENWMLSGYVNNALNQDYITERYARPAATVDYVMGAPLTAGVKLDVNW